MSSISKTLGGRISNLKDQWWSFLVAVGGQSSGIFAGAITAVSGGIAFLTDHLSDISTWFGLIWSYIDPVVTSLHNFLTAAFGFQGAGDLLNYFGTIMKSVLLVVQYLTTALSWMIDLLTPIADYVVYAAVAWYTWNSALAIFNSLMAVNPITWIILGIGALLVLIGMVIKYTNGWGEAWQHTVNGSKFLWQSFTSSAESVFTKLVNNIMIGINRIKSGWYEFKNAVGIGDSAENNALLKQISLDTERRKKEIADANKKAFDSFENAKKEFSQVGITVDKEGIKKDFQSIKNKFKNIGQPGSGSAAYDNYLANKKADGNSSSGTSGKGITKAADTIVSGGTRKTNITVNIQKLQDDTKIYVSNTEKGLSSLGDKVQEILLRAVNSVNQMQTG